MRYHSPLYFLDTNKNKLFQDYAKKDVLILGGGDGALLHELLKVFRTFYAKMFFVQFVIVQGGAQVRHHGRHR